MKLLQISLIVPIFQSRIQRFDIKPPKRERFHTPVQTIALAMMAFTEAIGMLFRMFKPAEKSQDNTTSSSPVSLHRLLFSKQEELGSSPVDSAAASKFKTIKSQLLKEGKLYEDKEFLTMVRPKEICSDAKFFVDSFSRFDVRQGALGDCWFLASLASLCMNKKLLFQVVPEGQSFEDGEYVGMFYFRFWRFGEWVEIIIDDRLPIVNGNLMYVSSSEKNEFWSPLFEKAYAQFRGTTYDVIDGGNPCVAMQDFTGGLTEYYFISDAPTDFFTILLKAFERNALMTCSTEINPNTEMKDKLLKAGLFDTHAYSLTKIMNLQTDTGVVRLLRIRNPWGHAEWSGAWSDKSAEWQLISDDRKKKMDIIDNDDGEFWICYEDFTDYFANVQLCHLSSDCSDPENKLKMASIKGQWIKGLTAGGSYEDLESFCCNPQYKFTLTDTDVGDTEKCEIIVGLTQKDSGDKIGFLVCPLHDDGHPPMPLDYEFISPLPLSDSSVLDVTREVSRRYSLSSGPYVIISFTEEPDQEKEYLLRVMSEQNIQITDYDGDLHFSAPENRVTTSAIKGADFSRDLFNSLASPDGTVGAKGLKEIFNLAFNQELGGQQITEDLCKLIIETAGGDKTDRLSYEEFKRLWTRLRVWHTAFNVCEDDGNNTIARRKLRAALRAAGWTVNIEVLKQLSDRFNLTGDNINFYEFINCVLRVRVMCKEREKALQSGALAACVNEVQTTA